MRHRSVADLMTPAAVSVMRGTTFKEIARLLDEFDITAVCVVDESNRPLGVVSEADLVRRRAAGAGLDTHAAHSCRVPPSSPCPGGAWCGPPV